MFPFWMASDANGFPPEADSEHLVAFTSLEFGTAFMQGLGETGWDFRLIGRASFQAMVPIYAGTGFSAYASIQTQEGQRRSLDANMGDEKAVANAKD
jgi:hypothetical protein